MQKTREIIRRVCVAVLVVSVLALVFAMPSLSSYAASGKVNIGSTEAVGDSGYYEIKITLSDITLSAGKSIDIALEYNNIAFTVQKNTFSSALKNYITTSDSAINPYHIKLTAGSTTLRPSGEICTIYFKPNGTPAAAEYPINATVSGVSANVTAGYIKINCAHSYKLHSTVESSCTVGGYTLESCTKCGEYRQSGHKDPLGHNYQPIDTVAPTCTEYGYTVEECTRCKNRNKVEGASPIGHEYGLADYTVTPPTCTQQGYTEYACLRDGCEYTDRRDYVPTVAHTEGDIIVIDSTCRKHGSESVYCAVCGILMRDKILELVPHDFKDSVVEPTCMTPGYTYRKCGACDTVRREEQVDMIAHSYTSMIEREASCEIGGRIKYTCSCGNSYTEEIAAHGHSYVKESVIAPTEESDGMITYVCTECGDTRPQIVQGGGNTSANDRDDWDSHDVHLSNRPDKLSGRQTLLVNVTLVLACVSAVAITAILIKKTVTRFIKR